jgi:hypothetical protein
MDKWDDAKLAQVVLSKAGNPRTTTDVGHFVLSIFDRKAFNNKLRLYVNILSKLSKRKSQYPVNSIK